MTDSPQGYHLNMQFFKSVMWCTGSKSQNHEAPLKLCIFRAGNRKIKSIKGKKKSVPTGKYTLNGVKTKPLAVFAVQSTFLL